jgi:glycosyltransferase involved in cell wall biosynthesis
MTIQTSIIIPTHNRRGLLIEMLQSLGRQDTPMEGLEALIVLDGCTDGTQEALQGLHVPYSLRAVPQDQAGPSAARNNGARLAKGDVLLFMDDDLLPIPGFLHQHIQEHCRDDRVVVLGRFLPEPGVPKRGWHIWEERIFAKHYRLMKAGRRPPAGRRLYSGNFSVRREHFLGVGGFDESLKRGEDVELGFRLEQAGLRFLHRAEAAAVHRGHRSFESWCSSAYLYGKTDVQLARQRGHRQVLPEIRHWYSRLKPPLPQIIALTLDRPQARNKAVLALRWASAWATAARCHTAAHLGYSTIY